MINECWCGSHIAYDDCHKAIDDRLNKLIIMNKLVPSRKLIKNKEQIQGVRESAVINTKVLDYISENIKVGMSTQDIDDLVNEITYANGAIPADLNFEGYPKSVCTSINDQVCHGIPNKDVILKDGDIVNVDVSTIYNGYYSDASRMFIIGNVNKKISKFVKVARECLEEGIKAAKPWGYLGDIGEAISKYAKINGYSVVREFCGHGIGVEFHEEPFVLHYGRKNYGMVLVPGMIFTIEPMINMGKRSIFIDESDGWSCYTADGSLSAQWECTLLITDNGVEILTI